VFAALSLLLAHEGFYLLILLVPIMSQAKEVEVYDIESGSISRISQDLLGPEFVRIDLEGKIYWADSNQLKQNTHQHEEFEGERKRRVSKIQEELSEVNDQSYLEWEDGFRRDANPDNEISIWEHIISVYKSNITNESSFAEKKEIYQVAVVCSFSEKSVVLDQVELSEISEIKALEVIND